MALSSRHYRALGLRRWSREPDVDSLDLAVAPTVPQSSVDRPAAGGSPEAAAVKAVATTAPPRFDLSVEGSAWDRHAPQQDAAEPSSAASSTPPEPMVAMSDPELNARIAHMDWATLRAELKRRSRPPATQGVFGVGSEQADLFVIGEAPGADEDRLGEPFVGRAGKLLDAMLGAIQHERSRNVYIANICKFRPPNNRDPRPEEIAEDIPILLRQIELVQPKLLLAVGRIAAQALLESTAPIGKLRGKVHTHAASGKPLVVTYHPAYLLRSPLQKAKAWDDLKIVRGHLQPPA